MPASRRSIGAGNRDSHLGFYDPTTGIFSGGTPTLPSTGNASGMLQLTGIRAVPLSIPEPENLADEGDDTVLGTFQFDSNAVRAYLATLAVHDQLLDSYLQSTNILTVGDTNWGVVDVLNATEINAALLHQSRNKKFDPTNRGQKAWEHTLVPLATVRPLWRNGYTTRAIAEYRLAITVQLPTRTPWGLTFTTDANSFGTDAAYLMDGKSDNPLHYVAWAGNALTTIPLDHVPVSAAKCAAWYNIPGGAQGVPVTVSSVSATGKTATISSGIPANAYGIIQYEYSKL